MFFLKISNADVAFGEKILIWKFYTINKALPTTKWVQLVDPKEFVIAALNTDSKTFIVYMAIWEQKEMTINPAKKTQIKTQSGTQSKAQVEALISNKAFTKVLAKYFFYSNVFLIKNVVELLKHTRINNHTIELEEGK